ncbi:MAG: cytochrome c-type biogenesis CcmF C-terminal domain-containing protein, partial [Planctomycetota bacterium]
GAFLLWSVFVYVLLALWIAKSHTAELKFQLIALALGTAICLVLSGVSLFVLKPFAPSMVGSMPPMETNPLLQNIWMLVHSPLLFSGYATFTITFVIAIAGILAGRTADIIFHKHLKNWLLSGICLLGMALLAAARWSYLELAMGRYWAWDPVENMSLLPWLMAVASFHCFVGIILSERYRFWAIATAPLPFIFSLIGTFITGNETSYSLHSLSQSPIFLILLTFITCAILLWLFSVNRLSKNIPIGFPPLGTPLLSLSGLLCWSSLIIAVSAITIGVATFWPFIATLLESPATVPQPKFYNTLACIAGGILAFMLGLSALAWMQPRKPVLLEALCCIAAGLISYCIIAKESGSSLLVALIAGICAFSMLGVLFCLMLKLKNSNKAGGSLAHLGLLLLILAVGFSPNEVSSQIHMPKGDKTVFGTGDQISYTGLKQKQLRDLSQLGPEVVVKNDHFTNVLWPHTNTYANSQKTSEAAIHNGLLKDIYITFDGIWQTKDKVVITVTIKPLMLWFWVGAALVAMGSALALIRKEKNPPTPK